MNIKKKSSTCKYVPVLLDIISLLDWFLIFYICLILSWSFPGTKQAHIIVCRLLHRCKGLPTCSPNYRCASFLIVINKRQKRFRGLGALGLHNVWVKRRCQHTTDGSAAAARIKWLVEENSKGTRWEWVAERSSLLGCENGHLHRGGPAPHLSPAPTTERLTGRQCTVKQKNTGRRQRQSAEQCSLTKSTSAPPCGANRTTSSPPPSKKNKKNNPTILQFVLGIHTTLS